MNESIKNTAWFRALKVLYVWLLVISIIIAITESVNESSDTLTFITSFSSLTLLIIIIFFVIKKSFFYILFGKKRNAPENSHKEKSATNINPYNNEIGQSFTEEDVLKAADYAGNLLRDGKTPIGEVFARASKKYNVPQKVISMLVKIEP